MRLKSYLSLTLCALLAIACGSVNNPEAEIAMALANGELSRADAMLCMQPREKYTEFKARLIEEYLGIDALDKAIYIYEYKTVHCSTYEMQYSSLHGSAEFTKRYTEKIYNALIRADRFDEAWEYHALSYGDKNYPGNAPDYLSYMSDVVVYLCSSGRANEARQFISQKSVWFITNVDNHEWGESYPNFRYDIMRQELNKIFNEAQQL